MGSVHALVSTRGRKNRQDPRDRPKAWGHGMALLALDPWALTSPCDGHTMPACVCATLSPRDHHTLKDHTEREKVVQENTN